MLTKSAGITAIAALAVGVAGCSTASSGSALSSRSASPTVSPPAANPSASATLLSTGSPPTPPAHAVTKEPEFSPESIRIAKKGKRGRELVLTVVAPQDTRFAIGRDYTGAACTAEVEKPGTPSTYLVVCPPGLR